jgi:hypothetical protein
VRRAKAIEKHLSAIICEPQQLRQLFDLWLGPSDELIGRIYPRAPPEVRALQLADAFLLCDQPV